MLQRNPVSVAGVYALRWSHVKAPPVPEWMLVSPLGPAHKTIQSVHPSCTGNTCPRSQEAAPEVPLRGDPVGVRLFPRWPRSNISFEFVWQEIKTPE